MGDSLSRPVDDNEQLNLAAPPQSDAQEVPPSMNPPTLLDQNDGAPFSYEYFGNGGNGRGGGGAGAGGDDDPYNDITLKDVGGLEEQKEYLRSQILEPWKGGQPQRPSWGRKPPKGILLYGPPGTGKTLLARAFGNELKIQLGRPVPFYHRKGGDLLDKWFGGSSRIIRELFAEAKRKKPSIIFLDEIDGVCPDRDRSINQSTNSVVTTMLTELDAVVPGEVFIFAATNRVEAVDPALRRPGRFDKHIQFYPPTEQGRMEIFMINTKKWKQSSIPRGDLLQRLAAITGGFTGADLDKLCREAFLTALDRHSPNADLDVDLSGLEVLEFDWNSAFNNMKPSNTAVFGTCLYSYPRPHASLIPLVAATAASVVGKLQEILPLISHAASVRSHDIESLYLLNLEKDESLEHHILPEVLNNSKFAGYPIYHLSLENLVVLKKSNTMSFIVNCVHQAASCNKPCILLLQQIDLIIESQRKSHVPQTLANELKKLKGKQVLVVATGIKVPSEIDHLGAGIFTNRQRWWPIKRVGIEGRKEYFREIIFKVAVLACKKHIHDEDPRRNVSKKTFGEMEELLDSIASKTEGHTISEMERLYSDLYGECAKENASSSTSVDVILKKLKIIFGEYLGQRLNY